MLPFNSNKKKLIIFAKNPVPGKVKTRIAKFTGAELACHIYQALLKDLSNKIHSSEWESVFYVFPGDKKKFFTSTLNWNEMFIKSQTGNNLGEKMYSAFDTEFKKGAHLSICIGSDIPGINDYIIKTAFKALENHDAVIGPSEDGGYYLIGFDKKSLDKKIFKKISWSTESVYAETINQFHKNRINFFVMDTLRDIDIFEDLLFFKKMSGNDKLLNPCLNQLLSKMNFEQETE